jgi:hypothetical protein
MPVRCNGRKQYPSNRLFGHTITNSQPHHSANTTITSHVVVHASWTSVSSDQPHLLCSRHHSHRAHATLISLDVLYVSHLTAICPNISVIPTFPGSWSRMWCLDLAWHRPDRAILAPLGLGSSSLSTLSPSITLTGNGYEWRKTSIVVALTRYSVWVEIWSSSC